MSNRRAGLWLTAGLALLLGSGLGCGTKRYEDRLQETVKRLGQESVFSGMRAAVQLSGTPVLVQLPPFLAEAPLPDDAGPPRLKPPSIEIPDLKLTYEGSIPDSAEGKQHFYCYLAATKKDPQRQLQQQVQAAFPEAIADWKRVDCEKPGGGTEPWQQLQCAGPEQEFYYLDKDSQPSYRKMPAEVRFYVRQAGDFFVVIGWRLPSSIEQYIGPETDRGLGKWAGRVAGSVTLKE